MLFSSHVFLFVFLPITLLLVRGAAARSRELAKAALVAASIVFYGFWDPSYVPLLLALIAFNYGVARWLIGLVARGDRLATPVFALGLAGNLGALAWFKYTSFALSILEGVLSRRLPAMHIVLPLGISFITFQKIAFLVDARAGEVKRVDLLDYALFVTFFPQLIAGPIVHHRDILPQLSRRESLRAEPLAIASGLTLFAIGLFKKAALADSLAPTVNSIYAAAAAGARLDAFTAWSGGVHYLLQLYYDFSGYSDMAIGLGMLFGVHLPFNFDSPYKALGFIDYWKRWHITLSRFLTAYVYNPITIRLTRRWIAAGKKPMVKGRMPPGAFLALLAFPTLLTMFVSGLWHGAGFQFLIFGLLHGAYLVIEHGWRTFRKKRARRDLTLAEIALGRGITLFGVLIASVFFRAESVRAALRVLRGMAGLGGIGRPELHKEPWRLAFVLALVAATQLLPSSQAFLGEVMRRLRAAAGAEENGAMKEGFAARFGWRPSLGWAVGIGAIAVIAILQVSSESTFLYFNF